MHAGRWRGKPGAMALLKAARLWPKSNAQRALLHFFTSGKFVNLSRK
ncbi:MAG: hypothetical protein K2X55_16495 [Burkholderiaceae bacterium]|nr:hypothetical protein [Burkholderiaceae bacterium]